MTTKSSSIILIGCGGHSRSVADVLLFNNPSVQIVFVDQHAQQGETILGFPVVSDMPSYNIPYHIALGNNQDREQIARLYLEGIKKEVSIIAQSAYLGRDCQIDEGCFIAHGAHIGPLSRIGKGTIINTNAVVEHETSIGIYSHIAPNTTICGRCSIGDFSVVGAGVIIKDNIKICSHVILGSGAVVVKNITEPGIYVGIPARKI